MHMYILYAADKKIIKTKRINKKKQTKVQYKYEFASDLFQIQETIFQVSLLAYLNLKKIPS